MIHRPKIQCPNSDNEGFKDRKVLYVEVRKLQVEYPYGIWQHRNGDINPAGHKHVSDSSVNEPPAHNKNTHQVLCHSSQHAAQLHSILLMLI